MGEISLYSRAISDYKAGKILINHIEIDDNIVDIVGYHLQQSVEKLLKFQIELNGEDFPFTHEIGVLADLVEDVPEWIVNYSETLTKYGVRTRYSSLRIASKKLILQLYNYLEEYIEQVKPIEVGDLGNVSNLFDSSDEDNDKNC